MRQIECLIKHYSSRTTEFKEYIAQGPNYLDFVALEENDLIYINQGKTAYKPPEKLVALYPKEGTFWHEHPFAIPIRRLGHRRAAHRRQGLHRLHAQRSGPAQGDGERLPPGQLQGADRLPD